MVSTPRTKTETYRSYFPYAACFLILAGLVFYLSLAGKFFAADLGLFESQLLGILMGIVLLFAAIMLALLGQRSYRAEPPSQP